MKYIEKYPECLTDGNGLLQAISSLPEAPWAQFATPALVEQSFAWHYNNRKLVSKMATINDPAPFIFAHYKQKWTKLWTDFTTEYNIVDATYIDETETIDRDSTNSNTTNYGRTSSDTGTVTDVANETSNGQANVWGYDSSESVPANSSTGSSDSTNTRTDNTVNTLGGSDNNEATSTFDETRTIDRKGNIGWFTPQNMLKDDIELWKQNFFDIVYDDVAHAIFLEVYDHD